MEINALATLANAMKDAAVRRRSVQRIVHAPDQPPPLEQVALASTANVLIAIAPNEGKRLAMNSSCILSIWVNAILI